MIDITCETSLKIVYRPIFIPIRDQLVSSNPIRELMTAKCDKLYKSLSFGAQLSLKDASMLEKNYDSNASIALLTYFSTF